MMLLGVVVSSVQAGEFRKTEGPKVDRQYIVVFKEDDARVAMDLLESELRDRALKSSFNVRQIWKDALYGASITDIDEAGAQAITPMPGVEYVTEARWDSPLP